MYKSLASILIGTYFLAGHANSCQQDCSTTIILQDPNGGAIEDANIELKVLCGSKGTASAKTNAQGEAFFPYSSDDLGEIRITLAGFGVETLERATCSGPENAKRCTIRFGT